MTLRLRHLGVDNFVGSPKEFTTEPTENTEILLYSSL